MVDDIDVNTKSDQNLDTSINNRQTSVSPLLHHSPLSLSELLDAPKSSIFEVRLKHAEILKEAGNDAFKQTKYEVSEKLYEKGLFHVNFDNATMSFEFDDSHRKMVKLLQDQLNLNLSRCSYQNGKFKDSISFADTIINSDSNVCPHNMMNLSKAFFCKGRAQLSLGYSEESLESFESSMKYLEISFPSTEIALDKLINGQTDDDISMAKIKSHKQAIEKFTSLSKRHIAQSIVKDRKAWGGHLNNKNVINTDDIHKNNDTKVSAIGIFIRTLQSIEFKNKPIYFLLLVITIFSVVYSLYLKYF